MPRPINRGRFIFATLLAPMIGIFAMIIAVITPNEGRIDDLAGYVEVLVTIGGAATVLIGLPAMLIIGLPIHAWLCRKNQRHWTRYAGYGAIAGFVPTFAWGISKGILVHPLFLAGAAGGCLTLVLFHLIRGPHLALTPAPNLPT